MHRRLPILLWRIFFAKFRWVAWMLALLLLYPFFYLLKLEIPHRSELTTVHGTYQMPYVMPTNKGNGHATVVRTSDGGLRKCNCSPATGSPNCLREGHAENLSLVRALKGQPVTVLMSEPKAYERFPLCYEIRTAESTLVSYEQSKARYLQDRRRAIGYLLLRWCSRREWSCTTPPWPAARHDGGPQKPFQDSVLEPMPLMPLGQ